MNFVKPGKAQFLAAFILIPMGLSQCAREKDYVSIMAVTGATPLALRESVKSGTSLEISGLTKKKYIFDSDALSAFAPTYIRTREVSPDGAFQGTYRYAGIAMVHILEGIAPKKPETAAFDKPLDMVVTFESASGKQAHFSYGELTMVDDSKPVILAFDRKQVLPSDEKAKKDYKFNQFKDNIKGLRLICQADYDTDRYLDDVKKIIFRELPVAATGLPAMKKGAKCAADKLYGIWNDNKAEIKKKDVKKITFENWIRTGHGKGFKGIAKVEGYSLQDLLKKNFPGCGIDNFFLFIACDGYRVIMSGRELFNTEAGKSMLLIENLDGKKQKDGAMLGPVGDYFVDRDVWGLSHIVVLDMN